MSLRKDYAETFAKFIRENGLAPSNMWRGKFGLTPEDDTNIFKGEKCKFYGIPFSKSSDDHGWNGLVKLYSPRFIQVWYEQRDYPSNYRFTHSRVFDNLVNAIMYLDLYFIKNSFAQANALKVKEV